MFTVTNPGSRRQHSGACLRSERDHCIIAAVDHRSQREVGTQLYIDRTTVVQLIDQLGAAGLVRRQRSEKDRRNITVGLTPRGLRRLGAAAKTLHQVEEEFLAPLATQEWAVLREALRTLASHHSRAEMLASRNNE
jgi:DNA-binding MarR family transcriptional regulator